MHRQALIHLLPWLALLLVLVVALRAILYLADARLRLNRLRRLHRDEVGSVQSLSFVLALPVFIMVMLTIVQVSQVMIGQIIVEYAAIAAARAAMVWVPASTPDEGENCIATYSIDSDQSHAEGGVRFFINPSSPKFLKVQNTAWEACVPIAPSRKLSGTQNGDTGITQALQSGYTAFAPTSTSNSQIPQRIANKVGYAQANTWIEMRFVHKDGEPPLAPWYVGPDINEFRFNEVGWQDTLQVKVFHKLALLPGPGRLLFAKTASPTGATDQVSASIKHPANDTYTYLLTASATIGNEGEKPVLTYGYTNF